MLQKLEEKRLNFNNLIKKMPSEMDRLFEINRAQMFFDFLFYIAYK